MDNKRQTIVLLRERIGRRILMGCRLQHPHKLKRGVKVSDISRSAPHARISHSGIPALLRDLNISRGISEAMRKPCEISIRAADSPLEITVQCMSHQWPNSCHRGRPVTLHMFHPAGGGQTRQRR